MPLCIRTTFKAYDHSVKTQAYICLCFLFCRKQILYKFDRRMKCSSNAVYIVKAKIQKEVKHMKEWLEYIGLCLALGESDPVAAGKETALQRVQQILRQNKDDAQKAA